MNIILSFLLSFFLVFTSYGRIENKVAINNGSNILYVGGMGPDNYTNIQDAINDANDGDTVFVYSGTYYEHVRIYKSINLIGENKETTIIDGRNETNVTVFSIEANYVNFSHFTIRNAPGGEWIDALSVIGDYIRISDSIIRNCDGLSFHSTKNILVENCSISHNLWGISISGENSIKVKNCTISYNFAKKDENGWYVGGYGIIIFGANYPIINISITDCSIHHNGVGIMAFFVSNIHISNCDLYNHNRTAISMGLSSNCTISTCNISHSNTGIGMGSSTNVTIEKCNIENNSWGIKVEYNNQKISILYNNIKKNTAYGIDIWGRVKRISINYNNICKNKVGLKAKATFCDARYNYWCSKLGPSSLFGLRGDKIKTIFAKVFYFPWLVREYE